MKYVMFKVNQIPKEGSTWLRIDGTGERHHYTVIKISSTSHLSLDFPPQVIHIDDKGNWW